MRHRKHRRTGGRHGAPPVDPDFARALCGRRDRGEGSTGRRAHAHAHARHKTMQLCRQVQRALSLALSGECGDELLRAVWIDEVVPAPDASRLMVRLIVPARARATPADVMQNVARAQGRLRAEVAKAITRKRAPELFFLPMAEPAEVSP
jgi:ribosome-binding factor A